MNSTISLYFLDLDKFIIIFLYLLDIGTMSPKRIGLVVHNIRPIDSDAGKEY